MVLDKTIVQKLGNGAIVLRSEAASICADVQQRMMALTKPPKGPVRDCLGVRGSFRACSKYVGPLLRELELTQVHNAALRLVRSSKVKIKPGGESNGLSFGSGQTWICTHEFDCDGASLGHARCIAKLTETSGKTIASIPKAYKEHREEPRRHPADKILRENNLLEKVLSLEGR